MNLPSLRWILCVASQAEWVHLCFIFSLVYIFLSLFFPPIPPLQLHGWPRVWLINLFLSFWHFLTHCQVAGLKFKRRSKMKLGRCVEQLSPTHSGNGCWFASAKVVEMFASWSHSRAQACCALLCPHLFFLVLHPYVQFFLNAPCFFIKQVRIWLRLCFLHHKVRSVLWDASKLAHQPQWICLKKIRDVSKISDQSLAYLPRGPQLMLMSCPSASHGAYDCIVSKQIVYF